LFIVYYNNLTQEHTGYITRNSHISILRLIPTPLRIHFFVKIIGDWEIGTNY